MTNLRFWPLLFFATAAPLAAADHFLTIGGGYSPSGNQISIEKNISFYQRVLGRTGHEDSSHSLFFADGADPGRDVQFEPSENRVPPANRYLAKLFGSEKYLDLQYRDHELERVDGKTSPENIEKWFRETGSQLSKGDRVVLYATAHGGRSSDKKRPHNTKLYLWDTRNIYTQRLAELIAELPPGVSVTVVMAQCYSGGFTHVLFPSGDAKKGDQDREISGFFSTTETRMAAGCTADIDEENYDEFSSHFWAALNGESRTGKPIESADYDGNGRVSWEEAHAYTLLVSNTIDIPQKTSDAFLKARSQFRDDDHPKLLARETPFSELHSLSRPLDQLVLERMSETHGLAGEKRYEKARKRAEEIEKKRKQLSDEEKREKGKQDSARTALRQAVTRRWPEVVNVMKPEAITLVTRQGGELIELIEKHPRYSSWVESGEKRKAINNERFELEKEWARLQRFLLICESVILAKNLETLGNEDHLRRFEQIREAEGRFLQSDS